MLALTLSYSLIIWDALCLNKLEISLHKHTLFQVWLKSAQLFWRRRILNFVYVFLLYRYYLLLEKELAIHLTKLEFLSTKNNVFQVLFKLDQYFFIKGILHFVMYERFLLFSFFPWKRRYPFLNKFESPSPKNVLRSI